MPGCMNWTVPAFIVWSVLLRWNFFYEHYKEDDIADLMVFIDASFLCLFFQVAKQAAETDTKLKEKGALLDKLQGELHFKVMYFCERNLLFGVSSLKMS